MLIDIVDFNTLLKRTDAAKLSAPLWHPFPNDTFDHPRYFGLTLEARVVLSYCYTRRSREGGPIWFDSAHTAHAIGAYITLEGVERALQLLIQRAVIRTLREEKREEERRVLCGDKPLSATADDDSSSLTQAEGQEEKFAPSKLLEIWNLHRGPLPAAQRMTAKRTKSAATRIKENSDPEYWTSIVQRLAVSRYATGQVPTKMCPRGWKADIDWLLENDTNHVKVAEGKYDDRVDPSKPQAQRLTLAEQAARLEASLKEGA